MENNSNSSIYLCRASTGMSNIIGNATYVVREFFKGLFPKSFFKDEFIDTSMVQVEMDKEALAKKSKPSLTIRPKLTLEDDSVFGKLPDWINTNYFVYRNLGTNYLPVFKDDEHQIYMYCSGERIKMTFDIDIFLDTKMQQINTAYYLKGSVLHKSFFYLNDTRLEAELPKYYIKQIAQILNMDLKDPEIRKQFNLYLNKHSQNFIQEKVKLSSGNMSHFYLFKANILSMFNNYPDMDDGENHGMTYTNFKVSETLEIEFWAPMNYFLEVGTKFNIIEPREHNFLEDFGDKITMHYTMKFPIPTNYEDNEHRKYEYYTKIMYVTDDNPKEDKVYIDELFTQEDIRVIAHALKYKIDINEIFHIDLYLDNYKVDLEHILINWKDLELINLAPKINDCYTLVVYRNIEKLNRMKRMIAHINKDTYN